MDTLKISEFAGRISIKYGDHKLSQETLEQLIQYAVDMGILYPEKLNRDRITSLIFEQ